jgi:hypothetical protein
MVFQFLIFWGCGGPRLGLGDAGSGIAFGDWYMVFNFDKAMKKPRKVKILKKITK